MDQLARQKSAVKTLQLITIGWMTLELCIAIYAGLRAHSIALTAFGADSGIELLSAIVVLRRFVVGPQIEKRAARICSFLLYALAAFIVLTAALSLSSRLAQAEPTRLGIALLLSAAVVMPLVGRAKKRLSAQTGSRALAADAAQSNVCAYMSWIALAGLLFTRFLHTSLADPIAALLLVPIVIKEANDAGKGELCECS